MTHSARCLLLLAAALAACTGDDPGAGTRSLGVEAEVHATPRTGSARDPSELDTDVRVRVTRQGQTVTTGAVSITSARGKLALVLDRDGRWTGTIDGYTQVYVVDVSSGADRATGIRVDGPDLHAITKPTAGAAIDASGPLDIAWQRAETADVATLRVDGTFVLSTPDSGTYTLAAGALGGDGPRTQRLRLARSHALAPTGAVVGSSVVVTVENFVDLTIAP